MQGVAPGSTGHGTWWPSSTADITCRTFIFW
jgi:hypothetical protein